MSSRRTTMFSPNVESEMNDSDLKEEPARMVTRGNVKQIYDQNTGSYKRLRTRTTRSCAAKTLDERRQSYEKRRKLSAEKKKEDDASTLDIIQSSEKESSASLPMQKSPPARWQTSTPKNWGNLSCGGTNALPYFQGTPLPGSSNNRAIPVFTSDVVAKKCPPRHLTIKRLPAVETQENSSTRTWAKCGKMKIIDFSPDGIIGVAAQQSCNKEKSGSHLKLQAIRTPLHMRIKEDEDSVGRVKDRRRFRPQRAQNQNGK